MNHTPERNDLASKNEADAKWHELSTAWDAADIAQSEYSKLGYKSPPEIRNKWIAATALAAELTIKWTQADKANDCT